MGISTGNLRGMNDICKYMDIGSHTALRWCRQFALPIRKIDGIWIGSKSSIDKWIKEQSENKKKGPASDLAI